jgi:hypothetical protein
MRMEGDAGTDKEEEKETLTMEVLTNHRELHIESKRVRASCIRFYAPKGLSYTEKKSAKE